MIGSGVSVGSSDGDGKFTGSLQKYRFVTTLVLCVA